MGDYPSGWEWLNNRKLSQPIDEGSSHKNRCGTLDMLESKGYLSSAPCFYHLPFVCEFSGWDCSTTFTAYDCINVSNSAFVAGMRSQGWFSARAFCRQMGGELAILNTTQKVMLLSRLVHQSRRLTALSSYWVGLRKDIWKKGPKENETDYMRTNQWDAEQPRGEGSCVIIQRQEHGAFWEVATCTDNYTPVCDDYRFNVDTIHYPTLSAFIMSYTVKLAVDKKMTHAKAISACNGSWNLPQNTETNVDIQNYMIRKNITTVWLAWQMQTLQNWSWVSEEAYDGIPSSDNYEGATCGSLDHLLQTTFQTPCHWKDRGYICQYFDNRPCWKTFIPYNCLKTTTSTFVTSIYVENWYVAESACRQLGAKLAVLKRQEDIAALINFYKDHKYLKSIDFFYIGLRKGKWILPNFNSNHNDLPVIHNNMWYHQEPHYNRSCAVIKLYGNSTFWESRACDEAHFALCLSTQEKNTDFLADGAPTTAQYAITDMAVKSEEVAFTSRESSELRNLPVILIVVASLLIAFTAACGTLTPAALKRQSMKNKNRHKQIADLQKTLQNLKKDHDDLTDQFQHKLKEIKSLNENLENLKKVDFSSIIADLVSQLEQKQKEIDDIAQERETMKNMYDIRLKEMREEKEVLVRNNNTLMNMLQEALMLLEEQQRSESNLDLFL